MIYLLLFLSGVVFIDCILPLLEKIFEWLISKIQLGLSNMTVKNAYMQKEIDQIQNMNECNTNAIGFQISTDTNEEDSEND